MDAWEIKASDNRVADLLPTFIIFCEDEVSEILYFRSFETPSIKVNAIGKQKSKSVNVNKAIVHCLQEGVIGNDGKIRFEPDEIQVWCVFDRDVEKLTIIENQGNFEFDSSIRWAESNSIKVAWSNDAFELWILLHFEDGDVLHPQTKHRKYYYDRLSFIFNTLETENADLLRIRSFPIPLDYKNQLKRFKYFKKIVLPHIEGKTNEAIRRAITLENYHISDPSKSVFEASPCTKIHLLVQELIRLGAGEEY